MNAFAQAPDRAAGAALRALARLIDYPDGELRQALPELRATLHAARRAGAPLARMIASWSSIGWQGALRTATA